MLGYFTRSVFGMFSFAKFKKMFRTGVPWIIIDYNGKMLPKMLSL